MYGYLTYRIYVVIAHIEYAIYGKSKYHADMSEKCMNQKQHNEQQRMKLLFFDSGGDSHEFCDCQLRTGVDPLCECV